MEKATTKIIYAHTILILFKLDGRSSIMLMMNIVRAVIQTVTFAMRIKIPDPQYNHLPPFSPSPLHSRVALYLPVRPELFPPVIVQYQIIMADGTTTTIEPLSDGTQPPSSSSFSSSSSNNNQPLNDNDGGNTSSSSSSSNYLIQVSETLPSHYEIQQFLTASNCGAISTFTGITRDNFAAKKVTALSYEGYIPMAIKELTNLCRDAHKKYPHVAKMVAVHILGDCPVGEASVVVGSSSPHRREAIACTEYLIDELKGRVPIWKKEIYEGDEQSVWKENVEWKDGRRRRVMVKQASCLED
jgi:molybdopterin synthase catalytic subunit